MTLTSENDNIAAFGKSAINSQDLFNYGDCRRNSLGTFPGVG